MQTNLRKHQQEGPLVITRGDGCRVYDNSGREYIESIAGLWCASLGFASERLAKVAYEQMRSLAYYHLYRHRSSEPAIALAEELNAPKCLLLTQSGHAPAGFAAMRSTGWAIVLDFEGGGSRPGKQSHEAAGIHQAFQQHGSCMAADRASAAGGDAGDRIAQRRLGRALAISRSRVPPRLVGI